jgi:hypothetical protein
MGTIRLTLEDQSPRQLQKKAGGAGIGSPEDAAREKLKPVEEEDAGDGVAERSREVAADLQAAMEDDYDDLPVGTAQAIRRAIRFLGELSSDGSGEVMSYESLRAKRFAESLCQVRQPVRRQRTRSAPRSTSRLRESAAPIPKDLKTWCESLKG